MALPFLKDIDTVKIIDNQNIYIFWLKSTVSQSSLNIVNRFYELKENNK